MTNDEKRIYNFSAGPAVLPEEVIRQAQADLWSLGDSGVGIMEHSHRGKAFDRVFEEAEADCRELVGAGDDYAVLFLQGGATLQFAMLPMSFLPAGRTADYLDTGEWAHKAFKEAEAVAPGDAHLAFDGAACKYDHTPGADELSLTAEASYLHYCSNNTIYGTRFESPPATTAPLVVDASSEMLSRPLDLARHAMVYAGAQKNLGPAGVTLVIMRREFLAGAADGLPTMLDYRKLEAKGSRLNTPPTFGIYVMGRVFKWIKALGGVAAMAARNDEKAALVYGAIEASSGFYQAVARADSRSRMNVAFRTPSPELDKAFVELAAARDMSGLKGHRSVGGLRASIYNAFPKAGCEALAELMAEFARKHG